MIGRAAVAHPWIFREARSLLDHGIRRPPPTVAERLALCRDHYRANVAARTESAGVKVTRRHLLGYLRDVPGEERLRCALYEADTLARCIELLDDAAAAAA
jgi:tRNA-dihydrouridine synthase